MSLVICSNQEKDGTSDRKGQSIYNAWSFRNPLSSNMTLPANCQVALQSCKVNVDGRVVFSRNNHRFYTYFGDKLDLDGLTSPQISDSTSYPVLTKLLLDDEKNQVVELSIDDFANRVRDAVRERTFYPNQKELFDCVPLRNNDSLDFLGYKFTFKQNASDANVDVKGDLNFTAYDDGTKLGGFNYNQVTGIYKRDLDPDLLVTSMGLAKTKPLSLNNGSFIVNISNGQDANANASDVEFIIGLSRAVQTPNYEGYLHPTYYDWTIGDDLGFIEGPFVDFACGRNGNGELVVFHSVYSQANDVTTEREIQYWNNTNSSFQGAGRADLTGNASHYTKFGFQAQGEKMTLSAYNSSSTKWELVTEYASGKDGNQIFKPINQACWCLHPTLYIGTDPSEANLSSTLQIEQFDSPPLTNYAMPTEGNQGSSGWWEINEFLGTTERCRDLERRDWNHPASNSRTYTELNGSGGTNHSNVMILTESDIYTPTQTANGREILGFNRTVVDVASSGAATNSVIFESIRAPILTTSMAMFVRLNNFTQNVVNAHNGNKSKIIAHLPRFDHTQQTGRLYFEPNNLVFIDLENPAPLQVNEFDISFCYVNEQYATVLTGQSIVALYFRARPKELM